MPKQQATKLKKIVDTDDYIICEVVKTPDGDFVLSAKKNVLEIARMYRDKLMLSRGIPQDAENINPRDRLVKYMEKEMPWVSTAAEKVKYLRGHYTILQREAWEDAIMLAVFADKGNVFTLEPTPYGKDEIDELPGLEVGLPKPIKNLKDPVERRLKQIIDTIDTHDKIFEPVLETINETINSFNDEETDEDGGTP